MSSENAVKIFATRAATSAERKSRDVAATSNLAAQRRAAE